MALTLGEIKDKYISGEIKSQRLETVIFEELFSSDKEMVAYACARAADVRREVLEEKAGVKMPCVKSTQLHNCTYTKDGAILTGIENKIGAAMIPLGFAGPVKINGQYAKGEFYLPMATNEAALIGGAQRGVKAINLAGGLNTVVSYDGMTRAPLLEASSLAEAQELIAALEDPAYITELAKYVKDPFVKLVNIKCFQLADKVIPRCEFKTGDAMGMNGATKAAADIMKAVLGRFPKVKMISLSSNVCSDKKSAHVNILLGRGKSVHAGVFLPAEALTAAFGPHITPRKVEEQIEKKVYLGTAFAGTLGGFNINSANSLAAFYAATGQDLAHVVSSTSSFLQAEAKDGGVLFQGSYPQLEIAATGGGTLFGTAREMLRLIGCDKLGSSIEDNSSVKKIAEIAAAAAMSLDLNTCCTIANSFELAESHVRLARGEKD